jgi:phosphocarrier protein FPr
VVGLVIVSHSARLAEGVAELAAQMAGPEVRIGVAAGLDEPRALGTDATRVLAAIEEVWSDDGVLVLMDLGSAVLSAELAADLLDDGRRASVLLTAAPLVEGAVAAAVAAGLGDSLAAVAEAARGSLAAKQEQVSEPGGAAGEIAAETGSATAQVAPPARPVQRSQVVPPAPAHADGGPPATLSVTIHNRLGLHARPAALLVRTLAPLDARVTLAVPARERGPADARSLTAIGALGVRGGDELLVSATGTQAAEALDAVRGLAAEGFGEPGDLMPERPSAGGLLGADHAPAGAGDEPMMTNAPIAPPIAGAVLRGVPAAPGLASGPARLLWLPRPQPTSEAAGDTASEWRALENARAAVAGDLRRARAGVEDRVGAAEAKIFDAHLLLLDDPGLLEPALAAVTAGEPAARAWADAIASAATAWEALDDPYQRARAADVRDVGDQVVWRLAGGEPPSGVAGLPEDESTEAPAIVITDELTPADVAAFAPGTVAGVACSGGGPTAHAVVLARALGIPMVVGAGELLLAVPRGTPLLVDGDAGAVTVRPPAGVLAAAADRRRAQERETADAATHASEPAVTRDGVTIAVEANIAHAGEAAEAVAAGADGVGLLRSEFLFLDTAELPDEDAQTAAYEAIAAALQGRPLTIRTLDAGADKPISALALPPEKNPFLGVRGVRLSLLHPDQLRCQLRAALRAAAAHPVRVLFPMIAEADELRRALAVLDEARAELVARGAPAPEHLETGVMLEVPSAALLAEQLAPLTGFFSVGTNDLTQYALAAERGNAGVAALGDPLHPAVLRLMERAAGAASAAGRPVAVCGEVAGDPLAVPLLLGLGVRELSMSPARVAAAKQAVRRTDTGAARRLAERALAAESAAEVRRLLTPATPGAGSPPD